MGGHEKEALEPQPVGLGHLVGRARMGSQLWRPGRLEGGVGRLSRQGMDPEEGQGRGPGVRAATARGQQ